VWVSVPADGAVVRVDPDTGRVVAKIPAGRECEFAATEDELWVAGGCRGSEVARVDPTANAVSPSADLAPDAIGGPVAHGGSL